MKVFQCNRCDFKSPNESDFAQLTVYLPYNKKSKTPTTLSEKFHQHEKDLDEADLINTGLKIADDEHYAYPVIIHLCPDHTAWFSNLFLPTKKRTIQRKKK